MDSHLKHWRNQDESEQQQTSPAKMPRLTLDPQSYQHPPSHSDQSALPLFVPEQQSNTKFTHLSASPVSTRFPRMGGGFFSRAQWQELELQALIYRHMLAGAAIPPELLQPILKKTLLDNAPPSHPYYLHQSLLQHYPHLQPALMQSGYWGRAALDPEPGRCRRTDGKKWRCSRDVAAGHKYCERHLHRGRNRSRKPVEIPTTAAGGGACASNAVTCTPKSAAPMPDIPHPNPRSSVSKADQALLGAENDITRNGGRSDGQVLRHFFDDWPRSLQETDNASATCLTISTPANPPSDTSLKLSTGNTAETTAELRQSQSVLNWAAGWGTNQVPSMGGPLAEALRSSVPNSPSPISVLHQLNRGCDLPETSHIST